MLPWLFTTENLAQAMGSGAEWLWLGLVCVGGALFWGGQRWLGRERVRVARALSLETESRREAEARLRRTEARYRSLMDATCSVLWVTDGRGDAILEEEAFTNFTGQSAQQGVGLGWLEAIHEDDRPAFAEMWRLGVARNSFFEAETRIFCAHHRAYRSFRVRAAPVQNGAGMVEEWLVALDDNEVHRELERERREIEKRAQEAQRMESLGVLAGGVAHDFNNLLVGVMGHAEWVLRRLDEKSPLQDNLQAIVAAAERAAALCKQMLAFAGRGRFLVEPCQVSSIAKDMHALLSSLAPRGVRLDLQAGSNLPPVQADPSELRQVLLSLVTNSAEALADRGTGAITVITGTRYYTPFELVLTKLGESCQEGEYVYIEVCDDGPGIPEDVLPRIFDPFFSTKFTGRGLSLAAVLGIARSHQGSIDVWTRPGQGTRMRVLLPALLASGAPARSQVVGVRSVRGTVLVIDDDEGVRELARLTLEDVGASVLSAQSGEEAIEIFRQRHEAIQVVLLDLTMPGMDSATTLRALRSIDEDVCVLLTSGYSAVDAIERLGEPAADGFLQKPWRPSELVAKLSSVMVRKVCA